MKTKIINRIDPCNCGCQGQDSQHAKTFVRVLHDVKSATGKCLTSAFNSELEYDQTAMVQLPWSPMPIMIYHITIQGADIGWFIGHNIG